MNIWTASLRDGYLTAEFAWPHVELLMREINGAVEKRLEVRSKEIFLRHTLSVARGGGPGRPRPQVSACGHKRRNRHSCRAAGVSWFEMDTVTPAARSCDGLVDKCLLLGGSKPFFRVGGKRWVVGEVYVGRVAAGQQKRARTCIATQAAGQLPETHFKDASQRSCTLCVSVSPAFADSSASDPSPTSSVVTRQPSGRCSSNHV